MQVVSTLQHHADGFIHARTEILGDTYVLTVIGCRNAAEEALQLSLAGRHAISFFSLALEVVKCHRNYVMPKTSASLPEGCSNFCCDGHFTESKRSKAIRLSPPPSWFPSNVLAGNI